MVLLILTLFGTSPLLGQFSDTSNLSASFADVSMRQFADEIQRKTGYRLYYDPEQLDTIRVTVVARNVSLSELLNKALFTKGLSISIDHRKNIFLTKGVMIATTIGGNNPTNVIVRGSPNVANFDTVGGRSSAEAVQTLASVTISAATNIRSTQMGVENIDIKTIRQVPVVFGEADVLRVVMSLPGVKTVGEASTGLNVRGGSTDQNLILFNDATIYNPSHFFGMFSAFNPDMVNEVTLYKGNIPSKFGGRLASVLEISGKEGNNKNITGSAGIGPLTSRIAIEGPIKKDKTVFVAGVRTTYANWLLKLLPQEYEKSKARFYDLNLTLNHKIDEKNELVLTGYLSSDRFSLNSDTVFEYSNRNISVKWKHKLSRKTNAEFVGGIDEYRYEISSKPEPVNAYKLNYRINQKYLRAHFISYLNNRHTAEFGLHTLMYNISPGTLKPDGPSSFVANNEVEREQALETAFYMNDKFDVTSLLSVEAGLRYSVFNYLGPENVNVYRPGVPKEEDNIIDTLKYGKGSFIKAYSAPEVRIALRYLLSEKYSLKAGFNTNRQYIHMLSNTAAMAPTDIWKLSDPNIAPQRGVQYSLGLYRNFKSNTIETSVEVYYKTIEDYLDYKSGANLIMNENIETDVISTRALAYGAEFHVKKTAGKFNGWLSYTYSRIVLRQDDPNAGEVINQGEQYPANYDKPHDAAFIGNYRINQRFNFSLNIAYSTGRPITVPIGRYYYSNSYRTLYGKRNDHRVPDYFRADFSMNIEGNHKVKQKTHNSWTIGVYNITGRKNPYSVYYISEDGLINGYKLSIFGSAIPFLTYNIRF